MHHSGSVANEIRKLEEELSRVFLGTKKNVYRRGIERVTKKQNAFIKSVQVFSENEYRLFKTNKSSVIYYMKNIGEKIILQRRMSEMRLLRSWLSHQQETLKEMCEIECRTINPVMKCLTRELGLPNPDDVLDRCETLISVKSESVKDHEQLINAYGELSEQHRAERSAKNKENLILNNKRHELDGYLQDKQREITVLKKTLSDAMSISCDSERRIFEITNIINSLYERVTTARGYEAHATTLFEKLDVIKIRMDIMTKTVRSVMQERFTVYMKQKSEKQKLDRHWSGSQPDDQNQNKPELKDGDNNNITPHPNVIPPAIIAGPTIALQNTKTRTRPKQQLTASGADDDDDDYNDDDDDNDNDDGDDGGGDKALLLSYMNPSTRPIDNNNRSCCLVRLGTTGHECARVYVAKPQRELGSSGVCCQSNSSSTTTTTADTEDSIFSSMHCAPASSSSSSTRHHNLPIIGATAGAREGHRRPCGRDIFNSKGSSSSTSRCTSINRNHRSSGNITRRGIEGGNHGTPNNTSDNTLKNNVCVKTRDLSIKASSSCRPTNALTLSAPVGLGKQDDHRVLSQIDSVVRRRGNAIYVTRPRKESPSVSRSSLPRLPIINGRHRQIITTDKSVSKTSRIGKAQCKLPQVNHNPPLGSH